MSTSKKFVAKNGLDTNGAGLDAGTGSLLFQVAGAEKARIDSSGSVGVGTTAPASKLSVVGDIRAVAGGQFILNNPADSSAASINYDASNNLIIKHNGNIERMRIDASGNVGIATSPGTYRVSVLGDVAVSGGFYTTSADGYLWAAHASGILRFGTANTERVRIDASGNLGVGTTSLSGYRLSVSDTTNSAVRIVSANETAGAGSALLVLGSTTYNRAQLSTVQVGTAGADLVISTAPSAGGLAERMRLTSTGVLLVGSTAALSSEQVLFTATSAGATPIGLRLYNAGTTTGTGTALSFAANTNSGSGTNLASITGIATNATGSSALTFSNSAGEVFRAAGSEVLIGLTSSNSTGVLQTYTTAANIADFSSSFAGQSQVRLRSTTSNPVYLLVQNSATGTTNADGFAIGLNSSGDAIIAQNEALTMQLWTNNIERMRIDSSGNVGVGRSPVTYGTFRVFDLAGSTGAIQKLIHTGSTVEVQQYASSTLGAIGTATNHPFIITTNDAERVRIDTSGNLLLNRTTSTGYKLEVLGQGGFSDGTVAGGIGAGMFAGSAFGVGATSKHPMVFGTNGAERVRIDASGNVGIGKTPSLKLDVTGSGATPVQFERSDGTFVLQLKGTGTTAVGAFGMATNDMVISTNSAERMRISSTGAVMVGGQNAFSSEKLMVVNTSAGAAAIGASLVNAGTTTSTAIGLLFGTNSNTSGAALTAGYINAVAADAVGNSYMTFGTALNGTNAERVRIDSSGNVGVGSTAPQARLHVKGTSSTAIVVDGSGTGTGAIDTGALMQFWGHDGVGQYAWGQVGAFKENGTSGNQASYVSFHTRATGGNITERMRIDSSGRLGIGTTSPNINSRLHVASTNAIIHQTLIALPTAADQRLGMMSFGSDGETSTFGQARISAFSSAAWTAGTSVPTYISFSTTPSGSTTVSERMRLDASGNLGLGTNNPPSAAGYVQATVNAATGSVVNLQIGGTTTMSMQAQSSIARLQAVGASTPLTLETNGTERMRIDSSGNVGIGGTPTYKLTVVGGDLDVQNGIIRRSGVVIVKSSGTETMIGPGGSGIVTFHNSSTMTTGDEVARFDASGNLGIGTTSPNRPITINNTNAQIQFVNATTGTTATDGLLVGMGGAASADAYINQLESANLIFNTAGTERMRIDSSGNVLVTGVGGLGYGTGSGGAVTQATSRTTGVTLNKTNGAITLVSAAGTATWQSFTVTNSTVAATDVIRVCQKSGTDLYQIHVTAVAAGSFRVSFATTGGTTTEQPVFNFAVIKAATA